MQSIEDVAVVAFVQYTLVARTSMIVLEMVTQRKLDPIQAMLLTRSMFHLCHALPIHVVSLEVSDLFEVALQPGPGEPKRLMYGGGR